MTKQIVLCTHAKATATESTFAYNRQCEQLQGILPTANVDGIMQTQKQPAIGNQFSTCRKYIE